MVSRQRVGIALLIMYVCSASAIVDLHCVLCFLLGCGVFCTVTRASQVMGSSGSSPRVSLLW